jgi:hypothetical protein
MNAISLYGTSPSIASWLEMLLALSALTMASTLPDWLCQIDRRRTVSICLPASGFLGLAMASTMAAIMQPELFAAVFGVL